MRRSAYVAYGKEGERVGMRTVYIASFPLMPLRRHSAYEAGEAVDGVIASMRQPSSVGLAA